MADDGEERLFKVQVNEAIKLDCIGSTSLHVSLNDWCIIKTSKIKDYGRVTYIGRVPEGLDTRELATVERQATLMDQGKANENNVRGKSLHRTCQEKIQKHDLPMTLRSTHLSFDRKLVIFVFTAPGRVDFRELVKDLNSSIGIRVELRQIGPRDEAGLVGGFGSCGRVLCCSSFLTNFVSINVKMAKDQGMSLNPSNIIGACGRLKCCLDYEYEGYQLLLSKMPQVGASCKCQGCDGKVIDRQPLAQTVSVQLDNSRVVTVPVSELE